MTKYATGGIVTEAAPAFAIAKLMGADYVRCRACATDERDTCQPLNGPDDMLCPCGKLREPYDCQSDEWVKV